MSVTFIEVSRVHQVIRLLLEPSDQPVQHHDLLLLHIPLDFLTRHFPRHLPHASIISWRLSRPEMYAVVPAPRKQRPAHLNEYETKTILAALGVRLRFTIPRVTHNTSTRVDTGRTGLDLTFGPVHWTLTEIRSTGQTGHWTDPGQFSGRNG
jgi:hypothetical protein